jgi:hypothetical protein
MHADETLREKYGIAPNAQVYYFPCYISCKAKTDSHIQPYTTYFPRADIHELITPDLLHQAIKGVYKDHLVSWVAEYLEHYHGTAGKERVLDEIDRRSVRFNFRHL